MKEDASYVYYIETPVIYNLLPVQSTNLMFLRLLLLLDDGAQHKLRAPNNGTRERLEMLANNLNVPVRGRPVGGTINLIHPLFAGFGDSALYSTMAYFKRYTG